MPEPTFSTTTERIYKRLPETYRVLDAQNDWVFKRWISGIGEEMGVIDTTAARNQFVNSADRPDFLTGLTPYTTYERPVGLEDEDRGYLPIHSTADLLDGRTANNEWLDWLALIVGTDITKAYTEEERRNAVIFAFNGYKAGSRDSLRDAVLDVLTGAKFLDIQNSMRSNGTNAEAGTMWEILLITKPEETPPLATISETIERKGAKPAGVKLYHISYNIIWSLFETEFPTWTAIEAAGSWSTLQTRGS
jgi:hypothetical protein